MIEQISIRGYRSLANVSVRLDPVTVLIGKSGTGKTNFMDAIRFLRDMLLRRNFQDISGEDRGWQQVFSVTQAPPREIAFSVLFSIQRIPEKFLYDIAISQAGSNLASVHGPTQITEKLSLGGQVFYHQDKGKWIVPPNVISPPQPGHIVLGAITGVQESSLAYSALTSSIGCYRFQDKVITSRNANGTQAKSGLSDTGSNFVSAYANLYLDLQHWQSLKQIEAAMRVMKPSLASITVDQPQNSTISTAHEIPNLPRITFDISQESEGFRRLFACFLALYQRPSKQTLCFDEPEKGIYTAALGLLAEEFNACANSNRGQVILTTHSPEFLDHFQPEQIRVVEMKNFETQIGPMDEGQKEAIKEQFLRPGELLTVDQARILQPVDTEIAQ